MDAKRIERVADKIVDAALTFDGCINTSVLAPVVGEEEKNVRRRGHCCLNKSRNKRQEYTHGLQS